MDDLSGELADRCRAYVDAQGIETEGLLGQGLEGIVWRTSRRSALKVHRFVEEYSRERDAYLRLRAYSLHRLAGFSIPILIHYDDERLALELSIVDRPFVLDFAQAALDESPSEFDDPAWRSGLAGMYGRDWPDVERVLEALRQYGIYFRDVHNRNISLRP